MDEKRPFGVELFAFSNLLSAALIMILLLIYPTEKLNIPFRFQIPIIPENIQLLIFCIISLVISYGYFKLKKWGYYSMLIYILYCIVIGTSSLSFFITNAVFSILLLVYTFTKRNYFINKGFV